MVVNLTGKAGCDQNGNPLRHSPEEWHADGADVEGYRGVTSALSIGLRCGE
jgi:hypothetical protein